MLQPSEILKRTGTNGHTPPDKLLGIRPKEEKKELCNHLRNAAIFVFVTLVAVMGAPVVVEVVSDSFTKLSKEIASELQQTQNPRYNPALQEPVTFSR